MTAGLQIIGPLAGEEDVGKAGPVGLFLILSLLIVVFFLGRSMRTHLRRVPLEFPDPTSSRPSEGPDASGQDAGGAEGEIVERPDGRPRRRDGRPDEPDTSAPNLS
ncbi:MAG: hypothetical protein M3313_05350 [Actinomycetota bacterium]|nr:hypothetical protein [Actinomycetota bacterium]